jgi:hypothetical protein
MVKKNNEDMAGSVSEPKGAIPEVRPAKSLWPRPHESVRVEPVLDTVHEEAPPVAPPVAVPQYEPAAESSAGPEEGYRAPEPRIDFEDEPSPEISAPEMSSAVSAPEISAPDMSPEFPIGPDEFRSSAAEETSAEETEPQQPEAEDTREEPVAVAPVREEPVTASEPEPVFVPRREDRPQTPRQAREDRHVSVLDRADRQKPALGDGGGGKAGKFIAMAAGIVVALAFGGFGLYYGASALGLKLGGGDSDTTASASAPATPAANPDDLKAMQDRVAELQAEIERLRQEKSASAPASTPENQSANASADEPANPPVEQASASQPEPKPEPVASIPGPTPAPNAVNAPPAATPAAPAPQAVAPAPSSEPTPKASTSNAAPTETARTEPTPAPPPPAAAPPPAPKPKPAEVARTEPAPPPPPPPSYRPQPSYEDPRAAASPEMPVLQNWAVRDVYNGIAVVQGGRGAPLEVEPGDELPGGNRVLAIRRLGGNWAVITERGIISGY